MGAPIGNQNAKKGKIWTDALKRAIARKYGSLPDGLDKLADEFIDSVAAGGIHERETLGSRLEGKPAQAIIGGEEDDPPLKIEGAIKLVRPD